MAARALGKASRRAAKRVGWWPRWLALWSQERRRERGGAGPTVPTVPTAPGNLEAAVNGGVLIELTWEDRSGDELGFRVYRQVDFGGYSLLQTISPDTWSAEDGDVVAGHSYAYFVTAFNAVGESEPSNAVEVVAG